jgi:hypothetical protein
LFFATIGLSKFESSDEYSLKHEEEDDVSLSLAIPFLNILFCAYSIGQSKKRSDHIVYLQKTTAT